MISKQQDLGVISSFMHRMQTQRLPRAQAIKASLDRGEPLGEFDLAFLIRGLRDAQDIQPMIARNPEYKTLAIQLISLYSDLSQRALENERAQS